MQVTKRDESLQEFDIEKIVLAIDGAGAEVDGKDYDLGFSCRIAEQVLPDIYDKITVEEIQDLVEKVLMKSNREDIAKSYIKYRYKREIARNYGADFIDAITDKITAKKVENSNANMDERSFGGRLGAASDLLMKQYALDFCVSKKAKVNHMNNEIYIHDLSSYAIGCHNCLTVPLDDLLAKGFNTRQTDVRPASSVNTAFQLVAVLFQLQSLMQFGGVSASHLDWTMVPYVRKSFYKHFNDGINYLCEDIDTRKPDYNNSMSIDDNSYKKFPKAYKYAMDMTVRETNQAVEGMFHNLNTLQSRSGNQLPFSSINYGSCTLPEGRIVIKAILDNSIKGVGKLHKTSIFPCQIFQLGKGINREPGDPNYDMYLLALKSTAQRLYPNYANLDWDGNAGYDKNDPKTYFSTMGK